MKNIRHLLDVVDKVRDHVALGLMSDPGLSKTSQVKQWADENDRRYCELIISQRMPSEISGMPMPVQETQKMEVFDFQTLLELEEGDVLAFDEFTNGNIQTLNACLTLIQERTMLSGKKLPSLVIVAMGNPQGRCDLLPQTKQRFWWVNVQWDEQTWIDYMQKTWGFRPHSELIHLISEQYRNGFNTTGQYNYHTPRTIENLLRIAMQIDMNDPFWDASDIGHLFRDALYASIRKVDEFVKVRNNLTTWTIGHMDDIEDGSALLELLLACHTQAQLKEKLAELEHRGAFPELFDYLKSAQGV